MAGNKSLNAAAKAKQDEFYTQLTDIEKELRYYKKHFRGKTVLCNCDDPYESNFFRYFAMNFNFLGLKKLIANCYTGSPIAVGSFLSLMLRRVNRIAHTRLSSLRYGVKATPNGELCALSNCPPEKGFITVMPIFSASQRR